MSTEVWVGNRGTDLLKIEVVSRDENGQFMDSGITYELTNGEFEAIALPEDCTLQINIKHR